MNEVVTRERFIDPFFENCFNQIFIQSNKSLFAMDGAVGTGKTSEFTVRSAYNLSCLVSPIRIGSRYVRESKWAFIRQSEQSAYNTVRSQFNESIFSPEIVAANPQIMTTHSMHPKELHIEHDLTDGTVLRMVIECHGFDNEQSFERLKTHEFLGAMIPEAQAIPWIIVTTAIERCGRWRAADIVIKRKIGDREYVLSGQSKLSIVLADINIPSRPHALYEEWYDKKDRSNLPFIFFTPPSPILPIPSNTVSAEARAKYHCGMFEGEEVVWVPNPKAYNFTRHYEETEVDEGTGRKTRIPWTGYNYWFQQLYRNDSEVRRYIMGLPDVMSGEAAIYRGFKRDDKTIVKKEINKEKPVYVGFDPGGHAALICMQISEGNSIHFFKEFIFTLADNLSTREQIESFFVPYCEKELRRQDIVVIPDPASAWLGKSRMSDTTESALNILNLLFREANNRGICKFTIEPPLVRNQQEDIRIDSLRYFIDQRKITIDPSCEKFIDGLMGGYRYKMTRSKLLSDQVDKDDPSCDVVEAAQYPCVNILKNINKVRRNAYNNQARQGSIRRW